MPKNESGGCENKKGENMKLDRRACKTLYRTQTLARPLLTILLCLTFGSLEKVTKVMVRNRVQMPALPGQTSRRDLKSQRNGYIRINPS